MSSSGRTPSARSVTGGLTTHHASEPVNSSTYTPGPRAAPPGHRGRPPADRRRIRGHLARPSHHHRAPSPRQHLRAPLDRRREPRRAHRHLDGRRDRHRRRARTGPDPARTGRTRWTARPRSARATGCAPCSRSATGHASPDARRAAYGVVPARRHYAGDATYTANVPRDQRHAVGTTSERYRLTVRPAATTVRWSPSRACSPGTESAADSTGTVSPVGAVLVGPGGRQRQRSNTARAGRSVRNRGARASAPRTPLP